jgi:hypothetical protein
MSARAIPSSSASPLTVALILGLSGLALSSHAGAAGAALADAEADGAARPPPADYNAYALEPGEFEVGLEVAVGVLPRLQVGTNPLLHAISAPNLRVKWNAFRLGPLDLSPDFEARWLAPRLQASLTPDFPLSLHGGLSWDRLTTDGVVDLDALNPLMEGQLDDTLDAVAGLVDPQLVQCSFQSLRGQAAAQLQLSRSHSLVAQASTLMWSATELPVEVPSGVDVLGFGEADRVLDPGAMHMASVGWQVENRHVSLRVGVGTSSVPLLWLTQAVRLSVRFGGGDGADRSELMASRALVGGQADSALASASGKL